MDRLLLPFDNLYKMMSLGSLTAIVVLVTTCEARYSELRNEVAVLTLAHAEQDGELEYVEKEMEGLQAETGHLDSWRTELESVVAELVRRHGDPIDAPPLMTDQELSDYLESLLGGKQGGWGEKVRKRFSDHEAKVRRLSELVHKVKVGLLVRVARVENLKSKLSYLQTFFWLMVLIIGALSVACVWGIRLWYRRDQSIRDLLLEASLKRPEYAPRADD